MFEQVQPCEIETAEILNKFLPEQAELFFICDLLGR